VTVLSGLQILLAEDNPTNQLVATQMLESLGASVTVAQDGAEALDMALETHFDVLLIDIEMPRMNGIELMRRLRASDGPVAALPLIALTAYVMREHVAAIDAAGADGVIAKPILSIAQFGSDIRGFMRRRAAPRGDAAADAADAPDGPDAPAGAVIDFGIYDALADIVGSAAMADLLGKVEADLSTAAGRLERAAAGPDLGEARAVSHVLISVAGTIGAVRAQDLARRMNRAAHAGDAAAVRRGAPALLAETGRVVAFVQSRCGGSPA
jgi:CheY-like chemotaxis protein